MGTNISVRRKIVVNGVEYQSVDDLPPNLRAAYEKALQGTTKQTITINGQHYDSLDAVPVELRHLIGDALGSRRPSTRLWAVAVLVGLLALIALSLVRLK